MKPHSAAALIYGPELHHLDHLAPLCRLMDMPLIVTEEKIAQLAQRYYPGVKVQLIDYLAVASTLVSHFDIIFYSTPRDLFDEIFFFAQKQAQKKIHTIWCPHGNSDKGNTIFYLEALRKEEVALVYGKQMIEFFQRKNVFDQLKGHVITGNYRHALYLQRKETEDGVVEREIKRRLDPKNKTLLYAPTWDDYESSSSFYLAIDPMVENLPAHYNLIVKLHPNLILQNEFKVEEILDKYRERENILFLTDFPLIYPLLNITDAYIGDMSSIGYDFLLFNRPMFFLNPFSETKSLYLYRCGLEIKQEQFSEIYTMIDHYFQFELRDFSSLRNQVYEYAFGQPKALDLLKKEIEKTFSLFPDPELNFY